MKKIIALIFLLTSTIAFAYNSPLFFQGASAVYPPSISSWKFLLDGKAYIDLSVDPSAGGGVAASIGSLGVRNNAGAGELWQKTGASNTSWIKITSSSITVGAFGSTPNSSGAIFSGNTISLEPASSSFPGGVSTVSQQFSGSKEFINNLQADALLEFSNGSGTVSIGSPSFIPIPYLINLPGVEPSIGQVLTILSQAGVSFNTSWETPSSSGGSVTSVSVVSANGLAGTVANATTTPAITLSTTVNGIVKGNGTSFSAATSGTDYQAPISSSSAPANQFTNGFTAPNTFTYAQPSFSNLSGNITAAQMLALPSADIYVGNGSNQPAAVAMSGDINTSNTGATTIQPNVVLNSKLAQAPANTLKGNNTGSTANEADLTTTQVHTMLGDVTTVGAFDSSPNNNAAIILGNTISLEPATGSFPGGVSIGAQSFSGIKSFLNGLDAGNNKITSVTNPTNAQDAATKSYVDSQLLQLNPAAAVYAASTANISGTYTNAVSGVCIGDTFTTTATTAFALDGVSPPVGSRVLLKNQTSSFQDGVWVLTTQAVGGVSGAILTRALDFDSSTDINSGQIVPVVNGTVNAGSSWYQTATVTTCNTDSQTWTQFSQPTSAFPSSVAFGSSPNANGGGIAGGVLTLQPADSTHPGGLSILSQTIGGSKEFISSVQADSFLKLSNGSNTVSLQAPSSIPTSYNLQMPSNQPTVGSVLAILGQVGSNFTTSFENPVTDSYVTQTAHGFTVGQFVYFNGTSYVLSEANNDTNAEVYGMVSMVVDANHFILTEDGYVTGMSGLTTGTTYYLSTTVAGAMQNTSTTSVGQVSKPVFLADSTTSGYVLQSRGVIISAGSGGNTATVWTAYTPTIVGLGSGGTPPTNVSFFYKDDGKDTIWVRGTLENGHVNSTPISFSLPAGKVINFSKTPGTATSGARLGWFIQAATNVFSTNSGVIFTDNTTNNVVWVTGSFTSGIYSKPNGSTFSADNANVDVEFSFSY